MCTMLVLLYCILASEGRQTIANCPFQPHLTISLFKALTYVPLQVYKYVPSNISPQRFNNQYYYT